MKNTESLVILNISSRITPLSLTAYRLNSCITLYVTIVTIPVQIMQACLHTTRKIGKFHEGSRVVLLFEIGTYSVTQKKRRISSIQTEN